MARKTRTTHSGKTSDVGAGDDDPALLDDAPTGAEDSQDDIDLVRMRVDPVWRRRMNARRKLEAYWEEKRLRAMIGETFEDETWSLE
jgi:hypothetical protein